DDAARRRPDAEVPRRVEHEEREEHEVEEVDRRDAEQLGPDHRVPPDPARARDDGAALRRGSRRFVDVHPSEEEGRPEEREAVECERVRALEKRDERAAERVAREERERSAAVHEAVSLDIAVARKDGLEEAAEAHIEKDA